LGHPETPSINLDRTCILIKSLVREGNNFIGKAKVINTPYGQIVKTLIEEGCQLGVSSRGLGTLRQTDSGMVVQNDFYLATAADVVAEPSAPEAFVQGIMEGREWVWDNGILKEADVAKHQSTIRASYQTRMSQADRDRIALKEFRSFLDKLAGK
jgi:hypothetical protein